MRTLILYYSQSNRTMKLCRNLQKNISCDMEKLRDPYGSVFSAYTAGLFRAVKGKASSLRPISRDVAGSDRIVLAGPVWAGHPAPALLGFLQQYELTGKEIVCLLTHGGGPGNAEELLRTAVKNAGALCVSCLTVASTSSLLSTIESGQTNLQLSPDGILSLNTAQE